ncbi:hypothetical protein C0J52_08538 [Blattella germanica]|nr:hypothetical protein C0J52_08538 [Blattella germanica]
MKVLAIVACASWIKRCCRRVMEQTPTSSANRQHWTTHLNDVRWKFQQLSDHFSVLEDRFQRRIGIEVLRYLDDLISRVEHNAFYIKQEFAMLCLFLMRSVMFRPISCINIEAMTSKFSKEAAVLSIHRLEGLVFLRLPNDASFAAFSAVVADSIKYLPLLKNFLNNLNCTDDILDELSNSCPQIELINVRYSKKVTNKCVLGILKMRNLKHVDLCGTSVSRERYQFIVQFKVDVENICWRKGVSKIIDNVSIIRLRNIVSCNILVEGQAVLKTVQDRCPRIQSLVLTARFLPVSGHLTSMRSLTHLSLQDIDYQKMDVSCISQEIWQKLKVLSLKAIVQLKMSDIISNCVNLCSLEIENCLLAPEVTITKSMHFQSLKELILVNTTECPPYYNNLYRYENLKEVYFEKIKPFDDSYFHEMFHCGAFRNLQRFMARKCGDLGIDTALALLKHCPRLEEIGCLRSWLGISSRDIATIVTTIKRNNYAVTVMHWFSRPHYFD